LLVAYLAQSAHAQSLDSQRPAPPDGGSAREPAQLATPEASPSRGESHAASEPRSVSFALGFSLAAELRADYGASTRAAFTPELLALAYLPLPLRDLYLRPGVRVGYDGLGQADMPRQLRVLERGHHELLELGLLFDGVVVPALTFGAGMQQRFITLETSGAVRGTRALDHSEILAVAYGALGLGIPIERGLMVIEPFVRVQHVFGDGRSLFRLGLDATLRL
jgi:hypothetical protein